MMLYHKSRPIVSLACSRRARAAYLEGLENQKTSSALFFNGEIFFVFLIFDDLEDVRPRRRRETVFMFDISQVRMR